MAGGAGEAAARAGADPASGSEGGEEEELSGSSGLEEEEELEGSESESGSDSESGGRAERGGARGQGSSAAAPKRKREGEEEGGGGDSGGECEIVDGLSGDEMDPTLIIPGGRAARRGRAASGNPYLAAEKAPPSRKPSNPYAGVDSDDDDF